MRKPLVGLGLSFVLLLLLAPAALAGGWAVSTIDPMATPAAGAPIDVGFTIRQHGMTPVDLADVAIAVTLPRARPRCTPPSATATSAITSRPATFAEGQSTWEIARASSSPKTSGRSRLRVMRPVRAWSSRRRTAGRVSPEGSCRWRPSRLVTVAITDAIVSRRRKPSDDDDDAAGRRRCDRCDRVGVAFHHRVGLDVDQS